MKPTHYRTARTLDEAVFTDTRYIYISPAERRIRSGLDVLTAVGLGLAGAVVLFYWLSY